MTETMKELTAGQMLTDARANGRRKREIATIAKQLCIREEYLAALESGDYHLIPEIIYVLGFARNYAMELGLNPIEVVEKIKKELGLIPTEESDDTPPPNIMEVAAATPRDADGFFTRAMKFIIRNWKWFVGGLVAVVIVLIALMLMLSKPTADAGEFADDAAIVATGGAAQPAYNVAVREEFGTENRDKSKIIIQATGESWVKIEDARGNTEFSRVLLAGDVYYVPIDGKYRGTFGRVSAIDVWKDGVLSPKIDASLERKPVDL